MFGKSMMTNMIMTLIIYPVMVQLIQKLGQVNEQVKASIK